MRNNRYTWERRTRKFEAVTRAAAASLLALAVAACTTTPSPFTADELNTFAADRQRQAISEDQESVTQSIDLYEAMARALKYNLDHKIEISEIALRQAELRDGEFDMLPELVARVDWSDRSNVPFQRSIDAQGNESPFYTSSSDPGSTYSGLELSWDILDYGLSYYRSKQLADEFLIAEEQRRSTINRVIEDVRTAYWRAVAAQRLLSRIDDLEHSAQHALEGAREQISDGEGEQLEALRYQREMLETIRRAQELRRDLFVAKNQLAALMNLPQNQKYNVIIPRYNDLRTPITKLSSEKMTDMALRNRPEMREIAYRLRINDVGESAAVLEYLPSIKAYAGINYDTNRFLLNSDWTGWGARVSWDLIGLAQLPRRKKVFANQEDLLNARAVALTQAIATQVYVSNKRFHNLQKETRVVRQNYLVSNQILEQTTKEYESGLGSERVQVDEELKAILAALRYDATYAEMQGAFANVYASVGLDAFDGSLTGNESVGELANSLRNVWGKRGDKG